MPVVATRGGAEYSNAYVLQRACTRMGVHLRVPTSTTAVVINDEFDEKQVGTSEPSSTALEVSEVSATTSVMGAGSPGQFRWPAHLVMVQQTSEVSGTGSSPSRLQEIEVVELDDDADDMTNSLEAAEGVGRWWLW